MRCFECIPFSRGALSNETWFYVGWFCFNTELAEKITERLQRSQAQLHLELLRPCDVLGVRMQYPTPVNNTKLPSACPAGDAPAPGAQGTLSVFKKQTSFFIAQRVLGLTQKRSSCSAKAMHVKQQFLQPRVKGQHQPCEVTPKIDYTVRDREVIAMFMLDF